MLGVTVIEVEIMNKNPDSENQDSEKPGSKYSDLENSDFENQNSETRPFEKLENDVCELRLLVERQLDFIVKELKRAEARDEWMTQQITESRRLLRSQTQTLDEILTAIQQGVRGLY